MKILMLPLSGFLAHITRLLEIARELRKLNHDIIFAGAVKYTNLAKEEGFEMINIFDFNPEYIMACLKETTLYFHSINTLTDFINKELEIYREIKPDLVIYDSRFSAKLTTKMANIKSCSITNTTWTKYAIFKRTLPEGHLFNRILSKKIVNLIMPLLDNIYSTVCLRPYNYHLRKNKLKRLDRIEDIWEGDLTLIADVKEFVKVKALPSNYQFIGPVLWKRKNNYNLEFLKNLNKEYPVIYLTMGSSGDASLFEKICKILNNKPYQLIVTTGGIIEKEKLKQINKNIYVEEFIPGEVIMPMCDLVIFHGGSGTMYQALKSAKPLIGIPTHFEQLWNIERLEELKLGIKLNKETFTDNDLINAIDKILNDEIYKRATQEFKKIIDGYNGAKTAAILIQKFLNSNYL